MGIKTDIALLVAATGVLTACGQGSPAQSVQPGGHNVPSPSQPPTAEITSTPIPKPTNDIHFPGSINGWACETGELTGKLPIEDKINPIDTPLTVATTKHTKGQTEVDIVEIATNTEGKTNLPNAFKQIEEYPNIFNKAIEKYRKSTGDRVTFDSHAVLPSIQKMVYTVWYKQLPTPDKSAAGIILINPGYSTDTIDGTYEALRTTLSKPFELITLAGATRMSENLDYVTISIDATRAIEFAKYVGIANPNIETAINLVTNNELAGVWYDHFARSDPEGAKRFGDYLLNKWGINESCSSITNLPKDAYMEAVNTAITLEELEEKAAQTYNNQMDKIQSLALRSLATNNRDLYKAFGININAMWRQAKDAYSQNVKRLKGIAAQRFTTVNA